MQEQKICGFDKAENTANEGLSQFLQKEPRESKELGGQYFDLHQPFGYVEAFSTIGVVCIIAFVSFLLLRHFKPKCKS